MSIFSEHQFSILEQDEIELISMSNNGLIAISIGREVQFYNMNGEKQEYQLVKDKKVSYLQWHPRQNILAIGYEKGQVTLYNNEQMSAKEDNETHKQSKIVLIEFNQEGGRMITSDERGLVVVWKGLQVLSKFQRENVINQITFCQLEFGDLEKDLKLKNSHLFFMGGKSGIVCLADDNKHCSEVCKVSGSIQSLLFYKEENSVVIITSTLLFVQFRISPNQKTTPDKKVKLSIYGDSSMLQSIWVGKDMLAISSNENIIRLWDIKQDQNYILNNSFNDKVIMIRSYSEGIIVGGTKDGRVIFWQNTNNDWKISNSLFMNQIINDLKISNKAILVKYGNKMGLIQETKINKSLGEQFNLLQVGTKKLMVLDNNYQEVGNYSGKHTIKGLMVNNNNKVIVQSNTTVEVMEVDMGGDKCVQQLGVLDSSSRVIGGWLDNIVQVNGNGLQVVSLKGVVKQSLQFNENEGPVIDASVQQGPYIALFTLHNYIRVFDLSRRELKALNTSRRFEDSRGQLGQIHRLSLNQDASKLAIQLLNQPFFFIYDLELDQFTKFPLQSIVSDVAYDRLNKKFLAVLLEPKTNNKQDTLQEEDQVTEEDLMEEEEEEEEEEEKKKMRVELFYLSSEKGLKRQERMKVDCQVESIYCLQAPFVHFMTKDTTNPTDLYQVHPQILQDFKNIDPEQLTNKDMIAKIMDFGYNLCINNMEEAYKSVKSIQDPSVWENMAQMCVRSKRLDVAEICIGKMRFGRGSKSIRESKKEPQQQAQMAMVAIQLNMKGEAEKLYRECGRWDLLNKMYQSDGRYQQSLDLSNSQDRINLANSHYKMARHYQQKGQWKEAMHFFQQSNTHRQHVVKMLIKAEEWDLLDEYVKEQNDPDIHHQYACHLEATSQFAQAINHYNLAEQYHKAVRIYLFNGDVSPAQQLVDYNHDPQSLLELAKYYESHNNLQQALHYYSRSQFFSHAVRLARQLGNDAEVMSLSQQAHPQVMRTSAQYFQAKGHNEKAVILLIKSHNYQQAMALAVKHKLFDYVKRISTELENQTIGEQLNHSGNNNYQLMAQQFINNRQFDKAAQLLVAGKQYDQALQMCIQHDVMVTEELANKILADKTADNYSSQLTLIADLARKQGNFDLASRKYIELNQKTDAIKCLIQLGDLHKVVSFAQNARQQDIYVLAANCLQASDWHQNPDIARNIILFYSKAKAFHKLADFYDNCAQLEIDEYKDFDKAHSAIKEAIKYLNKVPDNEHKLQLLQQKIFFIEKFISAKNDPSQLLLICEQLLENPSINNQNGIKQGDIYTLMIEYYYEQNSYKECFNLVQTMQKHNININKYLDNKVTEHIYKSVGHTFQDNPPQNNQQQEYDAEDYIDDEIQEEF